MQPSQQYSLRVRGGTSRMSMRLWMMRALWLNRMVVTVASPGSSRFFSSSALNPPMVSVVRWCIDPLASRMKTISTRGPSWGGRGVLPSAA